MSGCRHVYELVRTQYRGDKVIETWQCMHCPDNYTESRDRRSR